MNPKRVMVALALALTVSMLCTSLVARSIERRPAPPHAADVMVAAPSRALEAGEVLKADNLELVAWPASDPIVGTFSGTGSLVGREVLFPLGKGQPILDRDLSAPGSGPGLAARIPDGMRAIALRTDEVVGVAGFLLPGSHLDVLVTYRSDRAPEPVTATVLQNAVVLAAGHQTEPDPNGKTSSATVVTLLLTPVDAQRAVLASAQGAIHFVLRNGADAGRTHENPIPLSRLSAESTATVAPSTHASARAPQRTAAKTAGIEPGRIETILGERAQPELPPVRQIGDRAAASLLSGGTSPSGDAFRGGPVQ